MDSIRTSATAENLSISDLQKLVGVLLNGKLEMEKAIQHLQKSEFQREKKDLDMQVKFKQLYESM